MKQKLAGLKEKVDNNAIIVGDLSTPFSITDRASRRKINKEIEDLKNTTDQLYLTDMDRILHSTRAEYTLF